MKDCRLKNRQVKHTIILDVFNFGTNFVNGLMSKEVGKSYTGRDSIPNSPETEQSNVTRQSEIENILKIAIDLQIKVIPLERNATEIKDDNKVLRELLDTQYIKCESAIQMDTRSPTATDTRVNITARMSDSSSSDDDDLGVSDKADDTFYPPAKYMKKIRKLENKVKKLSQPQPEVARIKRCKQNTTGPKQSQSNNVTGDQDLYIGGVPSNISNTDDMKAYLKSRGIHKASHITQLSRTSEWLSFKVTLPRHSYHYALNHNGWTTGIRIRLFRESGDSRKSHQQHTGRKLQYRGRESQFRGRESEFRGRE